MARQPKQETLRVRCTKPFKVGLEARAQERDTTASELTREALYDKFPELKKLIHTAVPVEQPSTAEDRA